MARNEKTSAEVRTIAGRVLQRGWPHEAKALAASALTQAPDRKEAESVARFG